MRLAAEDPGVPADSDDVSRGAVVVVGMTLDSRSKELLTWALVKLAHTGDRVIALHILDSNTNQSSLLSLVKGFDAVLSAYEGFCNLKQVDLKLKVFKGSPIRKVLCREAKSCGATSLILGTSEIHHKLRSKINVAKYCAKNLPESISVVCVENGKILFQRESNDSNTLSHGSFEVLDSIFKRKKTLCKSLLSEPPKNVLSSSRHESENISMDLVPFKTPSMSESKSGWSIIHRMFFHGRRASETSTAKKSSLTQRISKLPSRQSVAVIYPDHKQIPVLDLDECQLELDAEKGAIVLYSANTNTVTCASTLYLEELKAIGEKYSTKCRLFSYQELMLATNNFISENLIGRGGSSQVYRGCLPGEQELAVKVLKQSEDVLKHFTSEIEIITSLQHKNIISLVGFCFEESQLLLVYNLLSRGSLEENLHGSGKSKNLFHWEDRFKVALGVAEALDHLHKPDELIIHGDVKSSNILLSDNFDPRLSDFGLATRVSNCSHHMDASDVAGTFGYLAPEYFVDGKVNEKVDVYAFGVVLLELLSGRKPIDNGFPKGQESLVKWAIYILKEGKISELQDPNLGNSYNCDQFESMFLAAILCIRASPSSRPDISCVLKLLQGDPEVTKWAREETATYDEFNAINGEQSATSIQSFINLALLNLEDDSASTSSPEQIISVEDYLGGRWSR